MSDISKLEKQIILCCKNWFNEVSNKSKLDQLKHIISKECKVDVEAYDKDLGAIYSFLLIIIKSFNMNPTRCIQSIYENLQLNYCWSNKKTYDMVDYIKSLMKIIEMTRACEIPYELGDPYFNYFKDERIDNI